MTDINGEILDWSVLAKGFMFEEQQIHLAGQSGIWKPRIMRYPISITTAFGGPYPDKKTRDGLIEYRYRGSNPDFWDNVGLREAMRLKSRSKLNNENTNKAECVFIRQISVS